MSDFKKALLWTAIPVGGLSIISAAGAAVIRNTNTQSPFTYVWFAAVACFIAAFVALIVFIVKRKNRVAAGILAGIGIGIVALGASCFANLSTIKF